MGRDDYYLVSWMLVKKRDDRKVYSKIFTHWTNRRARIQLILKEVADGLQLQLVQQGKLLAETNLPRKQTWEEQVVGVQSFMKQAGFIPQHLQILLEAENVVQLLIRLPLASSKDVAKMLPWELMGYLSGKIEDYAYSYLVVERNDEGQQLLVQALPKDDLAVWQERSQKLQLPLVLCRGQLNLATWPQELPLPEQLEELNLCSSSSLNLDWQCLPCCQILAVVVVICVLSTWGCLQYQVSWLEQRTLGMEQELQSLGPWLQRYDECVQREEQVQQLSRQLQRLEKQGSWNSLLVALGSALPPETWLQEIHQRGMGRQLELVGQTRVSRQLNQLVQALEKLPQVQSAQLLSTEVQGPATSYRILVEVRS